MSSARRFAWCGLCIGVWLAEGQQFIPPELDTVLLKYVAPGGSSPYSSIQAAVSLDGSTRALLGATSEGKGGCWAPWAGDAPPGQNLTLCEETPPFQAAVVGAALPPQIIIRGNQLLDASGAPIQIHGFNWFGFAQGWTMVEGLTIPTVGPPPPGGFGHAGGAGPGLIIPNVGGSDGGSGWTGYGSGGGGLVGGGALGRSSLGGGGTTRPLAAENANTEYTTQTSDFATIVFRQKALGFNAVRIPFRFSDLNLEPVLYNFPCKVTPREELQANLENGAAAAGAVFPAGPNTPDPTPLASGKCNAYLPNGSTLERFLWVIQYFVGAGFYVILDWHATLTQPADFAVASDPGNFKQNWVSLQQAIMNTPGWKNGVLQGRLMLDLMNEPDVFGMKWEDPVTFKDIKFPSLTDLYLPTMRALVALDPAVLIVIEGTGQSMVPGTSWGNGFQTDGLPPGASNPTKFYKLLVAEPAVSSRTIIGPHVYPPSISGWTTAISGSALWSMLRDTFGSGSLFGTTFPVVIGETGSRLTKPEDLTWMRDFVMWMNNVGGAADAARVPLRTWLWWAWSPTAADTGGLVKDNYITVEWAKVDLLSSPSSPNPAAAASNGGGLGLFPWYLS